MIGETLSHYRISKEIGSGGMGVVYEAVDTVLGRRVAIKTLKGTQDQKARLLREARAVSQITHPNIATVYGFGETEEGLPFIVMELVEGEHLNDYLKRRGAGIPEIVEIIIKIADAISAAHRQGIIHRDIKPSNIAVRDDGSVKVLDFGLSRQIVGDFNEEDLPDEENLEITKTQKGVILGTPLYLSPEQTRSEETDARTDVFSLGTLFYECLTDVSPFRAETVMDICAKILRDQPPAPSEINPNVPPALDEITLKALAKKPKDRYKDAGELADVLRKAQTDLPNNFRKISSASETSQNEDTQVSRAGFTDVLRRPYAALIVLAFVLALGLGAFAYWQINNRVYQPAPEAALWYQKGEQALNDGAFFAASKSFEQAVERDTNFVMAKIRLAESLYELGYIEDANQTRELANDLHANGNTNLDAPDEMRFQAINKTLISEFEAAIEKYKELADYAGEREKPQAFLDLGRAYQRNENVPEAVNAYEKVLTYNPDSAAAHLRLGALYGRDQEFEKSEKHFATAENLYKIQSNAEGEIEVNFQRGIVLSSKGDAEKAREAVNASLKKAEINEILYQQIKCLTLLSRILRFSGKTIDAVPFAEKSVVMARDKNINNLHAQALLELGTDFLFLGKYDQAENKLKEALDIASRHKIRVWENRIALQLGAFYVQLYKADEALKYIHPTENFFEKGNYKKDMLDLLSIKARAVTQKGDFDAALEIHRDLLRRSDEVGDDFQKARALKGIGTILANRDDLSNALQPLYESYSLYNSINKTFEGSYSLLAYSDALLQLGRVEEAENALNQVEGLAEKHPQILPLVKLTKANVYSVKGNYDEAIKIAEEVLGNKNFAENFEMRIIAASAYDKLGQKEKAKNLIKQVTGSADIKKDKLIAARAILTLAEITAESDAGESLASAIKAREMLKNMGKPSLEWQALALMSLAQNRLGKEEAKQSAAEAGVLFSTLSQKWSAADFENYSKRPDIIKLRELTKI